MLSVILIFLPLILGIFSVYSSLLEPFTPLVVNMEPLQGHPSPLCAPKPPYITWMVGHIALGLAFSELSVCVCLDFK